MERKKLEALVWKNKHRDFKGVYAGSKHIMAFKPGVGSTLIALSDMTEAELIAALPTRVRTELGL